MFTQAWNWNWNEQNKLFIATVRSTDGVHRNENFEEIIPVFSTFSNFFNKKFKKVIKAI